MTQYGFFIDLSRCIGCNACLIACKQWHDVQPGPTKWLRVYQWEKGAFPDIEVHTLPIMCFHCRQPACLKACPNEAIYKDEKYGAVLVDPAKCTGSRQCFEACPYGSPQFETDQPDEKMSKCTMCIDRLEQGLKPICVLSCSMRALEFGPLEELRQKYGNPVLPDYLPEVSAPCQAACPAGVDSEGYVKLIAEGRMPEALELFRRTTPLAGVLGRVCTHPCERSCTRGQFAESVPLCSLKRCMADAEAPAGGEKAVAHEITRKEKIAVIGSGPAGLSCGLDLTRQGYPVTVFEAAPQAGGQMRYGIPEYRLPKNILNEEIACFARSGLEVRTHSPVNSLDELVQAGYAAVFIAVGTWQSLPLNVPGEEAEGVLYAVDFLRRVNSWQPVDIGQKVVVVGGGSVAVDAARVAKRLGAAEVHLVCLECRDLASPDRMPAQESEIKEAEEEGIVVHPGWGIGRILTSDKQAVGIQTVRCLALRDESGAFQPRYDPAETLEIAAEQVIIAIGQKAVRSALTKGLEWEKNGTLKVDPVSLETSLPGVFAGGDAAGGPADIISAVAAGKAAAVSIARYLTGQDLKAGRQPALRSAKEQTCVKTVRPPVISPSLREGFAEVAQGFSESTARELAEQCLHCGSLQPSVVFKREDPKRQILPYDPQRALELWQKRHPDNGEALPDIFEDTADVTGVPEEGVILRDRLVLKPRTVAEKMLFTTDDE